MGDIPAADRTYLAQLVSAQAGVSESEAQRRVDNAIAQAKTAEAQAREAADAARKAAELSSLCTALSMVVGAFIACVAAALGGRLRDLHP
jgi:ABC-type transport system involved in cytochrome bd biosynthesis fused ATPase/permease subunit